MAGTVLVTGGSGYIAGFTIRQLIAEGWTVRTTIRSLSREAEVRGWLGVDNDRLSFFAADLISDDGWAEASTGCSHVAHLASPLPAGAVKHEDDLIVPAREGALRALRFARDAAVQRVVMTSSVAAIAYGHPPGQTTFTEADWSDPAAASTGAYPRSKTIAERAARDWIAAEGGALEMVTVNPSLVLGPVLAPDFSASVEVIKRLLSGSLPGLPPLGFGVVDVRDVADLHVRALTAPGIAGERFIASGRFMTMAAVAQVLRDRLGDQAAKVPTRRLPGWVLRVVALFDPMVRQITGEIGRTRATPATHAHDVLGWTPRPAEETIVDTAESLIERGVVKV
ncbi:SDR family oxidoreductase [Sphingomonas sp.]|uniref:SDR family oxidoreductase n=1 Tax=Sphingomonas sp. TaxID=28214 RepID=UPI003CC67D0B